MLQIISNIIEHQPSRNSLITQILVSESQQDDNSFKYAHQSNNLESARQVLIS